MFRKILAGRFPILAVISRMRFAGWPVARMASMMSVMLGLSLFIWSVSGAEDNSDNGILQCNCGVWGDVNGDGSVNPLDVVYMSQLVYYSNDMRTQPPNCPLEAGDINCDGWIDPIDVAYYTHWVYFADNRSCPDPCL